MATIADVPVADVPVADVPVAEVPVAEVPVAEVPVAEVPVAEVPVADAAEPLVIAPAVGVADDPAPVVIPPPAPPSTTAPAIPPARPRLTPVPPLPPYGRRGVLWALLTAGAVAGGPWSLAAWLALCGMVAVAANVRTWRRAEGRGGARPAPAGALLASVGAPLAAAGGRAAFAAVVCAALVLAVVPRRAEIVAAVGAGVGKRVASPGERAAVVGVELVAVGLCAGALVLVDRASVTAVAALLALVCCHDASRYLVGTGAPAPWEGAVAGVAAVGSATLALIVLQPSPLTGAYVWVLGIVVAAAGLVGRPASRLLAPDGHAVPGAWRRMDTLLVAAPVWLLVVTWARL